MAKAIKSWYSVAMNWTWHAKTKESDGRWFGYVEGFESEWGYFDDEQLQQAGAVEIEPGNLPDA